MMRSQLSIFTHYDDLPTVAVGSYEMSVWVDIEHDGNRMTIHCQCSAEEAEKIAEQLREILRMASGKTDPSPVVEAPETEAPPSTEEVLF